jgi:hypothetical protein
LVPLDLRRARGASGRLKETLIDSPGAAAEDRYRWRNFSSAMDRQAVGEALNALPHQQREVVKLAYFGGMTNREIADRLGVPVGGVRHRLRQALAAAGEYVDRGRATGHRVLYGLIAWLFGRSFEHTQRTSSTGVEHIVRVGMVIAASATAGAVLSIANVPAQPTHVERTSPPAVASAGSSVVDPPKASSKAVAATLPNAEVASGAAPVTVGVRPVGVKVQVPGPSNSLPIPVSLPIPISEPISVTLPIPTPSIPPLP